MSGEGKLLCIIALFCIGFNTKLFSKLKNTLKSEFLKLFISVHSECEFEHYVLN